MEDMMMNTMGMKMALSAAAGTAAGFLEPMYAPATLCTVMVALDTLSAVGLNRRMKRKGLATSGKVHSYGIGKAIGTLVRVYVWLTVSVMAQEWVIQGYGGFDAVRFIAGAICFWQLLSILENESTCSDASWAKKARKFLIDKASRHFGS